MARAASGAVAIEIACLRADDAAGWQGFLDRSATGTLYHDLRFLAYHSPGRYNFRHLVFRDAGRIVALLPGGLRHDTTGTVFASPLGASVGGLVLAPETRLETAQSLVDALLRHARAMGWRGIEITLPPAIYHGRAAQMPSFALTQAGFHTVNRRLCPAIPLAPGGAELYARAFSATAANRVRAARRAGATVTRTSAPGDFLPLLDQTYAHHGVAPTHDHAELRDLARRLPDRVGFHIARQDGAATGGICVLRLNAGVATTFYICPNRARPRAGGVLLAVADAMDRLAADGAAWLDLGPSADHHAANPGVMAFKESLGASYHCREHFALAL